MNLLALRRVVLLAFAIIVAVAITACGSSGSSSSSSSSETSSSETTEAGETSEGTAEGGGSVDYTAMLKEATEEVPSKYEGPTEPAPAKPGVKIGIIACGQAAQGCAEQSKAAEEAAKVAGWVPRVFDGKLEPTVQNAQILNALSWGAEVILLDAVEPTAVQTGLSAAQKDNVLITSFSNGLSEPNPNIEAPSGDVWPKFDVSPNFVLGGEQQGKWIVASSEGTANTAFYGGKDFPSIVAQQPNILKVLEECEGCTTSEVQYFTASEIGTSLGPEVVSYLRTHPEVDYVSCPYDVAATGMVPAIGNAGLGEQVQLVSMLGDEPNLRYIEEENVQAASLALGQQYMGFAAIDQTIREFDGQPLFKPIGENTPIRLITAENLPESIHPIWEPSFQYVQKFTELWTGS